MERAELINITKSKLDEISQGDELIVDVGMQDNKPFDQIIDDCLDESAKEVLLLSPIHMLNISEIEDFQVELGKVVLPEDYLRFVSMKMTGWYR